METFYFLHLNECNPILNTAFKVEKTQKDPNAHYWLADTELSFTFQLNATIFI